MSTLICEIFECQVCFESLLTKKPRLLSCGHTFCEICLKHLLKGGAIQCPKCRKITRVSKVSLVPVNCDITKMKEREIEFLNKRQTCCQSCLKDQVDRPAAMKCIECFQLLCSECINKHNKIPLFSKHSVIPVKTESFKLQICKKHGTEVGYICNKCLCPVCADCLMKNEHGDHMHMINTFNDGVPDAKKQLESLAEKAKQYSQKVDTQLKRREVSAKKIKDDIEQHFEIIQRKLIYYKKLLLAETENKMHLNNNDSQSSKKHLEEYIGESQRIIKMDNQDFIKNIEHISTKILNIIETMEGQVAESTLAYEFVPRPCEESLGEICPITTGSTQEEEFERKEVTAKLKYEYDEDNFNMKSPAEIAILDESIYYSDNRLNYVQRFTQDGILIAKYYPLNNSCGQITSIRIYQDNLYITQNRGISIIPFGCSINGRHQTFTFEFPTNIVSASPFSSSECVIVDRGTQSVFRFNTTNKEKKVIAKNMINLQYVLVVPSKEDTKFIVTETGRNRLILLNLKGEILAKIGEGQLDTPYGTAMTPKGNILVADGANNRVLEFSVDGKSFGTVLDERDELDSPLGLAYKHPFLWVTEAGQKVKCFELGQR